MSIKEAFLAEYDHEMGTTRRLLEHVPEDALAWKPHQKSMSLGELATHLAEIPHWTPAIVDALSFDLASADDEGRPKQAASRSSVLEKFDSNVSAARAKIAARSDAELGATWSLKKGGKEMFSAPRIAAIKGFIINHSIHHRGQLSVYLRLRDVPLPPIYGPTADTPR